MKKLFTLLTLTLVLFLLGCNQPAPRQTDKVSVDNPPITEQANTDEKNLSEDKKTELKEIQQLFEKLLVDAKILDTSSWQTYVSPEGKYSLKYPKWWYHVNDPSMGHEISFDTFSPVKPPYPDSYYGMIGPNSGFLLDISVDKKDFNSMEGDKVIFKEDVLIDSLLTKIIFSYEVYESAEHKPKKYYAEVYLKVGNYFYTAEADLYNLSLEDKNNDINLLKTILTTFKFADGASR